MSMKARLATEIEDLNQETARIRAVKPSSFLPRSGTGRLACLLAELVSDEGRAAGALESSLLVPDVYGVIHSFILLRLGGWLDSLGERPKLGQFIITDLNDERIRSRQAGGASSFFENRLGSKLCNKLDGALTQKLRRIHVLQAEGWDKRAFNNCSGLPIEAWLVYSCKSHDLSEIKTQSEKVVSQAVGEDRSVPNWIRNRYKPHNCGRPNKRAREYLEKIEGNCRRRYNEAGGNGSPAVQANRELAMGFPKLVSQPWLYEDCDSRNRTKPDKTSKYQIAAALSGALPTSSSGLSLTENSFPVLLKNLGLIKIIQKLGPFPEGCTYRLVERNKPIVSFLRTGENTEYSLKAEMLLAMTPFRLVEERDFIEAIWLYVSSHPWSFSKQSRDPKLRAFAAVLDGTCCPS